MGTKRVSAVLEEAGILLYDKTNVHWPTSEMLRWLNAGQLEIVKEKPDAYALNETVQLAAGTRQSLPEDGITFIRVVRNMGTDGQTPGRVVTGRDLQVMDDERPDWHVDEASPTVKHYFYDPRDPKHFYVWPPQPQTSAGHAEVLYAAAPPECEDPQDNPQATIQIDDVYANSLLDYCLYRALSKQSKSGNRRLALETYNIFLAGLGRKEKVEALAEPRQEAHR